MRSKSRFVLNKAIFAFFFLINAWLFSDDPAYLIVMVDSKGYDYTCFNCFFQKFCKTRSFGHAWIYLEGNHKEERVYFEGGQSGEIDSPSYAESFLQAVKIHDPNPASRLFDCRSDGFLQWGNGGHACSFAALFPLSNEEFISALKAIHPNRYDYSLYHISHQQCVTFVERVLSAIGIEIDCSCQLSIHSDFMLNGKKIRLWQNALYSSIQIASPEKLQSALIEAVKKGRAYPVPAYTRGPNH